MYLNGYLESFMQEQVKLHDSKKRARMNKGKEEGEIDNTKFYLLGNQIMASCGELHDFMSVSAVKQQLLTKLTGVDKVSTDL